MGDFRLSERDVEALTAFLLQPRPSLPLDPVDWTKADIEKGGEIFRGSRCVTCHEVNGRGGTLAPALTHVGAKASREWLYSWIKDPHRFQPKTLMPRFRFTDEQIRDLASYLSSELRGASRGLRGEGRAALPGAGRGGPCRVREARLLLLPRARGLSRTRPYRPEAGGHRRPRPRASAARRPGPSAHAAELALHEGQRARARARLRSHADVRLRGGRSSGGHGGPPEPARQGGPGGVHHPGPGARRRRAAGRVRGPGASLPVPVLPHAGGRRARHGLGPSALDGQARPHRLAAHPRAPGAVHRETLRGARGAAGAHAAPQRRAGRGAHARRRTSRR